MKKILFFLMMLTLSCLPWATFAQNCSKPTGLFLTYSRYYNEMTATWNNNGQASNWVMQYGWDPNFAQGTYTEVNSGFDISNSTISVSIPDSYLTFEKRYFFRVKAVCGNSESEWSNISYHTLSQYVIYTHNSASDPSNFLYRTLGAPIWGSYANQGCLSQFIIPAEYIPCDDIGGSTFKSLTFYTNPTEDTPYFGNATFEVYLKEVNYTAFTGETESDLEPWNSMSLVYSGRITVTDGQMYIPFSNDYHYNSGNLMIGIREISNGSSSPVYYECGGGDDNSVLYAGKWEGDYHYDRDYRHPTVTISYIPSPYARVIQLHTEQITTSSATMSWTNPDQVDRGFPIATVTGYKYQYKKSTEEWPNNWNSLDVNATSYNTSVTLEGLDEGTNYDFRVKALYDENESGIASTSFRTAGGIPVCAITFELDDPMGNNWDGGAIGVYYYDENNTNWEFLESITPEYNVPVSAEEGQQLSFRWMYGNVGDPYAQPELYSWTILAPNGDTITHGSDASNLTDDEQLATYTMNCSTDPSGCFIKFELTDSFGDGWNGNAIQVWDVLTGDSLTQFANTDEAGSDEAQTYYLRVDDGQQIEFRWQLGNYPSECSWFITASNGDTISQGDGDGYDYLNDFPLVYTTSCPHAPTPLEQCFITLELTDYYGNGWDGNVIEIRDNQTGQSIGTYACSDHQLEGRRTTDTITIPVVEGQELTFIWRPADDYSYPRECSWIIKAYNGDIITQGNGVVGDITRELATDTVSCSAIPTPPVCEKPLLYLENVTPTSFYLSWSDHNQNSTWQYVMWNNFDNPTDNESGYVNYVGLTPNHTYDVYVRSVCGLEDYSEWQHAAITTVTPVVGDYWIDDFEGPKCRWDFSHYYQANRWHWDSFSLYEGGHALFISNNDNPNTTYYTKDEASTSYASRILDFGEGGEYTFEYDWISMGQSIYDYFKVVIAPWNVNLNGGTLYNGLSCGTIPEGWIEVGDCHFGQPYWKRDSVTVEIPAGMHKVIFLWHNDDDGLGENPPATIDNFSITKKAPCPPVSNLYTDATSHALIASWASPTGDNYSNYTVRYGIVSDPDDYIEEGTSEYNFYFFTNNIYSDSLYYIHVRTDCDENDHSLWMTTSQRTEAGSCSPVTNLHVNLTGNGTNSAKIFWTASESTTADVYDIHVCTVPVRDLSTLENGNCEFPMATRDTTFSLPNNNYPNFVLSPNTTYYVYVRTRCNFNDGNSDWAETTFTTLPPCRQPMNASVHLIRKMFAEISWERGNANQTDNYMLIFADQEMSEQALENAQAHVSNIHDTTYSFSGNYGQTYYIYVANNCDNDGHSPYVYAGSVTFPVLCPPIQNLTANNVTANTVQLSWNRGEWGEETQWYIERYLYGANSPESSIVVNDSTVIIFGLQPETNYSFRVQAQCDNTYSSIFSDFVNVTTLSAPDNCYTVANSTTNATSNSFSPIYGTRCHQRQRTQSIYPASMLTELIGKTITQMKYYVSASQNYNWRNKVFTVKLATVNEESIDTSFVYLDNYTIVYTGTLYATMSDGMVITFNGTAPFTYQGGNLLVEFESTTHNDGESQDCWFEGIPNPHGSIYEYIYQDRYDNILDIRGDINDFLPKVDFCTEPSLCPAVRDLAVSDITGNSAHVSWMPGSSETLWQYICSETELSNQALQDYNWLTAYDLFVNLSNLNANTTYHVYVRPLIRGNNYCSDEIQHTSFTSAETTPTDCPAVTNLRVIGMDPDAAQITWTHGGNETLWDLYWTTSDVAPTYTTTPTVGRTPNDQPWLAPLTPNTHYYAYVRARCSDENRSQWSPAVEFTTLSPYIITFNAGNGGTATVGSLECGGYLDLSNVSATPTNYCQNDWTFIGWSETPVSETTNTPSLVGSNYYPSGNTTLYAVYQQGATYNSNPECGSLTYTITYMDGNDILDVDTFEVGATITPIADPTKEGYTFTGWTPALPAIMPDYDFRVIAQWQVNKYNITINQVTGGTITVGVVDNYGNAFSATTDTAAAYNAWVNLSVETDAGYTFGDYVVTTASGIPIEIINSGFVMPAENVTISANFESEKHILTINYIYSTSGNNIYPSYKDTLEYGESYSVVSPPENDGFYPSIDTVSGVMGAEDITISVSYLPRVYQVTLHPRGGMLLNGFTSDTTYTRGQVFWLPTADDIVREGYSFGGWFTDTNFNGNPWIAIPNVATGDWDLYAKWDLLPCLAPENLALASGSLTATSALITWNSNQNNAFGGFYYENGVLAGSNNQLYQRWNLSELQPNSNYRVGVFAYCSLDRVSDTVWVEFTTNDTCYPPVSVSISDVTAHSALLSYDFGEHVPHDYIVHTSLTPDFNIHGTLSTMPEYFPNAITIRYYLNAPLQPNTTYYVRLSSLCDPNTNFTSVWSETLSFTTLQEYAVTIDANITNGTVTVSDTAAIAGAIVNLTATPNHGYSFGEWVVTTVNTPAPETVTVTNNSFVMPEGGVNVSATFIPNKYVLTYKNGNNIQYQDSVAYGTAIRPITDPTREGYTFIGWVPELPATMPAYDVTVHAQWQINRYQLTINYFYFENGTVQAAPSYTDTLEYGESYSVVSPSVQGFNPTTSTVSGVMGTDDITVRVDYIPEVYQVTLHTMGGTLLNGFTSDTIHRYTEVLYLPTANDIAREGYSFGGWFTDTNFNGNPWTVIPNVATGDWDLYAKWVINSYEVTTTVTPDANAGTVTGAGTYNYGSEVEMRAEAAEGYLFSNWTNAQGVVVSTDAIFDFEITNDTAFTANFTAMGVVATPTFSPAGGTYYDYDNVHVTLECSSSGATIYYTTDGSTPTANSTTYSSPITITENTTIKAIAMKEGMTNSEMATATYVITPTYTVTIANDIVNGIVRADASRAAEGETVNLTAIANNGYHLSTWAITTETGTVEVSANNSFAMPAGNVTISATFEPNGHTITYYNVSGEIITVDTFAYGDTITPIADPSVVGYTFTGWYPALPTTMPDYDLTPMAHWQINRYRININQVQGGIVQAIEVVDYSTGETIVIDSADYGSWVQISAITNDGCTYNDVVVTDANGTVLSVSNNGFTMPASDVTVTPRFTIQEFTITYGDRGNIFKVDTFAYGANITPIADPTWEGHTFIGWDPALPITMPANNLFVDALWQVNSYKVTVTQVTGGTITINYMDAETYQTNYTTTDDSVYYGAQINLRVVTDNGYNFNSYVVTNADGSPIAITNNSYFMMPANDVTISASFDVRSYELTINYLYQNGAEAAPSYTDTIEYNTAYSVVSPALTGYTASQDTVMGTMGAENMIVRVIYSINSYNITVNQVTGGTVSVSVEDAPASTTSNTTANYNTRVQLSQMPDNGYSFNGFTVTTADGTPIAVQNNAFTMPANDVTVSANFTANEYTITYYMMNGSNTIWEVDTFAYGDTITTVANPIRDGYTFTGWSGAIPTTMPAHSIAVSAQWQVNSYNITINQVTGSTITVMVNNVGSTMTTTNTSANFGSSIQLIVETANGYTFNNFVVTSADGTLIETPNNEFFMPANDVTVSANITANEYTITYMNGNDVLAVDTVACGDTITPIADPTMLGHTFIGWGSTLPTIMPAHNVIASPQWQVNKYRININQVQGGYVQATNVIDSAKYASWVQLSAVANDGYTFYGIVVTDTGGTVLSTTNNGFAMPASDVTVTATFTINSYDLTIHYLYLDGTQAAPAHTETIEYNTAYSVVSPVVTGYTASQDTVMGIMGAADVIERVIYRVNSYNITYISDQDTFEVVTYDYGETIDAMSAPEKEGYTFTGWNPAEPVTMPDSNMTLYAQWELIPCMAAENLAVGSITATSALITWNSSQDNSFGGVLYENGVLTESESQLFQRWNLSELQPSTNYRVGVFAYCSFDRVSDTVWVEFTTNDTCYPPVSVSISDVTAHSALLSYDFGTHVPSDFMVNISTDPNFDDFIPVATSTEYFPSSITLGSIVGLDLQSGNTYYVRMASQCNPMLISVWSETLSFTTLQEYAITIDANITNGTVTADDSVATAGTVVNLTATPDNGYSFGEWIVTTVNTPAPETITVTDNSFVMPEGEVNVSATFTPNSYNITINQVTGGTIVITIDNSPGIALSTTADYNSWINLDVVTFDGYTFNNFVVTNADGSLIPTPNNSFTMPANDVTVTATFTINSYDLTIHYLYQDGTQAAPTYTETIEYNTAYSVASPVLTGYTASQDTVMGIMGAEDVIERVIYSVNSYNITYISDLDTFEVVTYNYGDTIDAMSAPEKEGYTFIGWNPAEPITMPDSNMTLYAQWELIPCMAAENLAVANGSLTATSALITWNSSQDNSFGGVLYENGVLTESESQLFQRWNLSELQPSTNYRVGVFAYCSFDRISDTVWVEFTTNDTCYPPVSISIDNIKAHEATLHYSFGEHVPDNYIVLISTDPDFVDPISLSTSTSAEYYPDSIVLNSIVGVELQAGTTYYLKMSSFCSIEPELISVWTETINFTTLQEYAITIDDNITNGTVTADATVAAAGTVVNLTATPDNGYSFGEWVVTTVNTPAPEIVTVTDNSFVMPEGGVNVSATFTPNSYKVTINQATGGVVMIILEGAAVGTTIGDSVQYNSWVRLDALTFDGYTFGDFVVTTASGNTIEVTNNGSYNGFMMPAEDVTVTATFSVNNYTITYMDGNSILVQDTFAFGANITPIANPTREGYTFTGWNPALPTTMPAEDLIVNALWQVNSYDITINQVTGGTITVSFAGESATSYVSTTTDTSANFETWIQLSADADYGYDFVDFMVTTVSGDTLETTNNGFIMPAENVTVTAAFTLHNFNITVNVSDQTPWGTVSGSGSFAYGSTDTLTATADEGYIFLGWNDLSIDNPRIITVDRDSNFIAFFIPEEIEIISNDTLMGHVNVQLPGGGHLSPNTPIVITAVPEPHYHFVSWSDGNTDNPRTIFPAQAIGLTAIFAIDQHTITVLSNDDNWGQVIGGGTFDYGTEISIQADALTGYVFLSWNDGNTENPRHITVEQDSTFTAIFQIQDGINDANMSNVNVYSYENQVVVANAEGFSVEIFDMSGRLVISENNVSQSIRKYIIATDGIYLVKVGNSVFKKVKIAR